MSPLYRALRGFIFVLVLLAIITGPQLLPDYPERANAAPPRPKRPKLVLQVSAPQGPLTLGEEATLSFVVTNDGELPVREVRLELPANRR